MNSSTPQNGQLDLDIEKVIVPSKFDDHHDDTGAHSQAEIDPALEARVVRKLDWHVVPLVSALYLFAFLDRSNIGNAHTAGFDKDLHMDNAQYQWLLTIFYISYIIFEFQGLMWKVVPPHRWAAICVAGWGIASTAQAAIHSWSAAMALRFLLGVFEAGFGPGVPYLLSFFYLRHELGLRCGLFLSAAPLANTFAGALAYGITSGRLAIAKWRVLFLVEGIPTIFMAAIAWLYLADSPEKAKFLNEEEVAVARARGVRQTGATTRERGLNWKHLAEGLLDPKGWILGLIYFSCNVSFSSLPVFLPTIIHEMGFSSINAQGLTAPPYFLSFLITILTPYIADRTKQRTFMIAGLSIVGGIGYVLLATTKGVGTRYFGVFMAAAGVFPAIANVLPLVLNNQGNDTRRGAGIVLLNVVGQCGPILGTRLFPANEGPFYVKGQSICAAFMFFTTFLVLTLRAILMWENKKLDREYGTIKQNKGEVAVENYGPLFRYVL